MNTYELVHELYEAQLHSDNGIPNQMPLPKKGIPMHVSSPIQTLMQFSWMRTCDSAVHVKIKIAKEALILMLLSTIVNRRLTMCENDKLFN